MLGTARLRGLGKVSTAVAPWSNGGAMQAGWLYFRGWKKVDPRTPENLVLLRRTIEAALLGR